ncbi:MAG: FAD-dependent oxidoreductase [Spirochaetia bacterium]|jgi:nitrite reductase (NADH) large subunit|nr:FAD-dependent oxidoreductase [Spirochaetia bacterium]
MKTIVIGNGPAGNAAAAILAKAGMDVTLYSDEKVGFYSRIKLPQCLESIQTLSALPQKSEPPYIQHKAILHIDRTHKMVIPAEGKPESYDKLILATGSKPRRLFVDSGLDGILTLRTYEDACLLLDRLKEPAVVLGGGLLGLEAAIALKKKVDKVFVIENANHILARQVNDEVAALIKKELEKIGIEVYCGQGIASVTGKEKLKSVVLSGGKEIEASTLLLSIGVIPSTSLAKECGLKTERAIEVDAHCATSDPDIFAIGDCAQFNGSCPGLMPVALAMAKVAASCIMGKEATYQIPTLPARFEVDGLKIASFGHLDGQETTIRKDGETEVYYCQNGIVSGIVLAGKLTSLAKASKLFGKPFDPAAIY